MQKSYKKVYEKLHPWECFLMDTKEGELMILNNNELRARADEFALTHELSSVNNPAKRFWPGFRSDMNRLHEFADYLQTSKAECKQPAEDWLLDHINFIETQSQNSTSGVAP